MYGSNNGCGGLTNLSMEKLMENQELPEAKHLKAWNNNPLPGYEIFLRKSWLIKPCARRDLTEIKRIQLSLLKDKSF